MRKVFRGILDYTTASFPAAQRDQWKALNSLSTQATALPMSCRLCRSMCGMLKVETLLQPGQCSTGRQWTGKKCGNASLGALT
eukprot:73419-Pleurochrysis_carterae.AAC.1